MTKQVQFEGKIHDFPDDATDDEIRAALSLASPPTKTQAQPTQGTGDNIADFFIGGGKKIGSWATTPSRILSDLGVPGYKNIDYSWTQPQGTAQQLGAGTVGAIPYFAMASPEAALYKAAAPAIRAYAPGLRGLAAEWLSKGLIGGTSAAGSAYVNQEDPATAAMLGAGIPMAAQPGIAAARWAGGALKRGAQTSMGKAIGANYLNRSKQYVLNNIINPLLRGKNMLGEDTRSVFGSLRQLEESKRASAHEAMTARDLIRGQKPPDFSLTYGDVLDAAEAAKSEFRPIQAHGGGVPQVSGDTERKAISKIGDLVDEVRKTNIDPQVAETTVNYKGQPTQVKDLPINELKDAYLLPDANTGQMALVNGEYSQVQGAIPVLPQLDRDAPILFDVLEDFKQQWSASARAHGKYQGKKMVGMAPESSYEVEAMYQMANKVRDLLKNNMPERWHLLNQQYHIDTEIANLAEQRWMAKMGAQQQLSETMLGEIPTSLPTRAIARGYIKMLHSPWWNSAMAHAKEFMGNRLSRVGSGEGFAAGQTGAYLANNPLFGPTQSGAVTTATEGEPLDIKAQTAQPYDIPVDVVERTQVGGTIDDTETGRSWRKEADGTLTQIK
jgi:hypothetical protein